MNGNYERILSGELFPGDEPSLEDMEREAVLQKETDKYFEDLALWIEAARQEKAQ
jgi:hypothetical protein